jgi:methylation protein EvaC
MPACRACDAVIEPFIDFGPMPLANGFLSADQFAGEYFFNLTAAYCPRCTLVQLVHQPDRDRMFNDRYPFFTATSSRMQEHFATLARELMAALPDNALIVEIGSNDGTLLRHAVTARHRHLGIEPSESVANAARAIGVNTSCRFFDAQLAREIVAEHGRADAIVAANALSHVADLHSVVEGMAMLLAPNGTCVVEDPYWGDVIAGTAFDQIYDEHASYFSLSSISHLFAQHDLDVVDAIPQDVHGGSMRYVIRHAGAQSPSSRAAQLLSHEHSSGLHQPPSFAAFRERVRLAGRDLLGVLREHRAAGRRVVGYGATSKSTTTINFFGITPDLIEFISDTTPAKQGLFTPGMHIPVRPHAEFAARYPDRALLFPWNHAAEIRARERAFTAAGGRWIVYVPEVREL